MSIWFKKRYKLLIINSLFGPVCINYLFKSIDIKLYNLKVVWML